MSETTRGLVIVHTGKGKGKTTAAAGLALRAAGQGMRILFVQLLKGRWRYGEMQAFARVSGVEVVAAAQGLDLDSEHAESDRTALAPTWARAREAILAGEHDLVVLDDANYLIHHGLLDAAEVTGLLARRPRHVHVLLTGRNAPRSIVDAADLVTEMNDVKHPFHHGIMAQKGIDF